MAKLVKVSGGKTEKKEANFLRVENKGKKNEKVVINFTKAFGVKRGIGLTKDLATTLFSEEVKTMLQNSFEDKTIPEHEGFVGTSTKKVKKDGKEVKQTNYFVNFEEVKIPISLTKEMWEFLWKHETEILEKFSDVLEEEEGTEKSEEISEEVNVIEG